MNKIAKTVLMTGTALCAAGVVLSTAGYFAGGKDFTYTSDHMYVSGGNSSSHKNLAVMKKEQIDDFTKLNVDFENFDLDIRTSDDDHYYMIAADYPFESFSKSATYISSKVLYYLVNGRVGKRVGYATITYKNGNTQIIALVATY